MFPSKIKYEQTDFKWMAVMNMNDTWSDGYQTKLFVWFWFDGTDRTKKYNEIKSIFEIHKNSFCFEEIFLLENRIQKRNTHFV